MEGRGTADNGNAATWMPDGGNVEPVVLSGTEAFQSAMRKSKMLEITRQFTDLAAAPGLLFGFESRWGR